MKIDVLLHRIDDLLVEFEKNGTWGTIEIEIRDGAANFIRTTKTEKVAQENTRAREHRL